MAYGSGLREALTYIVRAPSRAQYRSTAGLSR